MIFSHATLAFDGAAEQICSHPATAALVPYRKSQPDNPGGGAMRSRRFGNAQPFTPTSIDDVGDLMSVRSMGAEK